MKKRLALKYFFSFFALTIFSVYFFSGSLPTYAYDWFVQSSPVDSNDFYYNFHIVNTNQAFFVVENNDMKVNSSSINSVAWFWDDGANAINRSHPSAKFTGLFANPSVTMTPGYRYICSVTLQVRRDFIDLSNSFKGFTSDFYLYSSSYSGNYSRFISPSDTKLTNSDRLQAIYEFDFNPESMFSNYYSNIVNGYGFRIMFNEWPANSSAEISSVRIVQANFKCIVLSPEDYETLKTVEGITKMDVETFERISSKFEASEDIKDSAADEVFDMLPDIDSFDFEFPDIATMGAGAMAVGEWMQDLYNEFDFIRYLILLSLSVSLFFVIARITHV